MDKGCWDWDELKNKSNLAKHKIPFELALRAFNDPLHVTLPDPSEEEERWRTFGQIQGVLILIVHTDPIWQGDRLVRKGRIISARKAITHERKLYEEAVYGC